MHNTSKPTRNDMPTSRQLLRSTFLAMAAALCLLVTVVLPAEYGIDVLGVGRVLGLTQMGNTKVVLAAEADAEKRPGSQLATAPANGGSGAMARSSKPSPLPGEGLEGKAEPQGQMKQDRMTLTLNPGEGAEIKLAMSKSDKVSFQWTASGPLNVDAHGDPVGAPKGFYHGYGKAKQVKGETGEIQAAFDGKHGWFWRNRSADSVTLELKTNGQYQSIKRVL